MGTTGANDAAFHHFSRMPPELRNRVWQHALPDTTAPALFFYKPGCWCPLQRFDGDQGFDPDIDGLDLELRFCHDLLTDIRFEIPMVSVNREARGIALGWAKDHGFRMRPGKKNGSPTFTRKFDPHHDALYVTHAQWIEFLCEEDSRTRAPDLFGKMVSICNPVFKLALPLELLRTESHVLEDIFDWGLHVNQLFVVVGPEPVSAGMDEYMDIRQWWELKDLPIGASSWSKSRRTVDFKGVECGDNSIPYHEIEAIVKSLREDLKTQEARSIEFYPAFAIRKMSSS